MAVFKLGAIITNIAGSIGGTTFRRIGSGFSMYNKSRGGSRARLLSNDALPTLSFLNTAYSGLSVADKASWKVLADTLVVPNKFGDAVKLTARNWFQKCNGRRYHFGDFIENATGYATNVEVLNITGVDLSPEDSECMVTVSAVTGGSEFILQVLELEFEGQTKDFGRVKVLFADEVETTLTFNMWDEFSERFPNAAPGQIFAFNIWSVNPLGMSVQMPQFEKIAL